MTFTFQKELDDFAQTVRFFCRWVEEGEFCDPFEELKKVEKRLAALHLAVLQLPEAAEFESDVVDFSKFGDELDALLVGWAACRAKFEKLPVDGYWEIFDASKEVHEAPVFAMVSDDLADIYSDLKTGLLLYENEMFAEACWEWRFKFQIHWGNHLVGAQKAIRNYIAFKGEL